MSRPSEDLNQRPVLSKLAQTSATAADMGVRDSHSSVSPMEWTRAALLGSHQRVQEYDAVPRQATTDGYEHVSDRVFLQQEAEMNSNSRTVERFPSLTAFLPAIADVAVVMASDNTDDDDDDDSDDLPSAIIDDVVLAQYNYKAVSAKRLSAPTRGRLLPGAPQRTVV